MGRHGTHPQKHTHRSVIDELTWDFFLETLGKGQNKGRFPTSDWTTNPYCKSSMVPVTSMVVMIAVKLSRIAVGKVRPKRRKGSDEQMTLCVRDGTESQRHGRQHGASVDCECSTEWLQ